MHYCASAKQHFNASTFVWLSLTTESVFAETLVHSSFTPVPDADFIVPVEVDGTVMQVYVIKRPLLEKFLQTAATMFEVIVFTASLQVR